MIRSRVWIQSLVMFPSAAQRFGDMAMIRDGVRDCNHPLLKHIEKLDVILSAAQAMPER